MGIGRGFHKSIFEGFEMEELKVHLTVNAYGKESRELGSWDCPDEGECNLIEENFDFGDSAGIEGICLRRAANGEDGNVEFDTHIVMNNRSDLYLPRVEFKAVLLDKKGEMIEESVDTQTIEPNGSMEFFPFGMSNHPRSRASRNFPPPVTICIWANSLPNHRRPEE